MVALPAEECRCGFNFRTGRKPPPLSSLEMEETASRAKFYLIGGAAAFLLIILFVFIFSGSKKDALPPPTGPAGGGGALIQPVTENLPNPLLNPAPTINRTMDVAGQADDRVRQLQELNQQLEDEASKY
jgi:hypothetical protein